MCAVILFWTAFIVDYERISKLFPCEVIIPICCVALCIYACVKIASKIIKGLLIMGVLFAAWYLVQLLNFSI